MKIEFSSHQHGHHDVTCKPSIWPVKWITQLENTVGMRRRLSVCAADAPKWHRVFSIASRVNLRWLACLPLQISSAHIQLYWRSWTEVTYSCNLTWLHRHDSSKDWASSCCQCTGITAKNNAIQLVPCVFSDALHLCLASGSFFFLDYVYY